MIDLFFCCLRFLSVFSNLLATVEYAAPIERKKGKASFGTVSPTINIVRTYLQIVRNNLATCRVVRLGIKV